MVRKRWFYSWFGKDECVVLHNKATIRIMAGNTFSDPQFIKTDDPSELERFDYIVANPPFSLKNWSDGLKSLGDFFRDMGIDHLKRMALHLVNAHF